MFSRGATALSTFRDSIEIDAGSKPTDVNGDVTEDCAIKTLSGLGNAPDWGPCPEFGNIAAQKLTRPSSEPLPKGQATPTLSGLCPSFRSEVYRWR